MIKPKLTAHLMTAAMMLISTGFGLLLAEIVAGRALPAPDAGSPRSTRSVVLDEYAPSYDVFIKPSAESLAKVRKYRIRTDSNGFIIGPEDVEKGKRPIDIIFLGGSTTECLFVDEELRFPYLVEQMLRTVEGSPIHTVNGGISRADSLTSLISLVAKGIAQRPRFVLLMHNINDLTLLTNSGSYWKLPSTRQVIVDQTATTYSHIGLIRYAMNLWFPNIWRFLHLTVRSPSSPTDEWSQYRGTPQHVQAIKQFAAITESLVYTLRAWNIEPILMTEFNRFDLDDPAAQMIYESSPHSLPWPDIVDLAEKYNQTVRDLAERDGVFLIDLAKTLRRQVNVSYDLIHLSDDGSKLVAAIIANALALNYPAYFVL